MDTAKDKEKYRKVSKSLESTVASSVSFEDLVMTMHSPWPEISSGLLTAIEIGIGRSMSPLYQGLLDQHALGTKTFALEAAVSRLRHPPSHLPKSNSIQIFTSHLKVDADAS